MAAFVVEAADPELALDLVPELELAVVEVASLVAIVVAAAAIFNDAAET
jgi:hypothetical protein